MLPLYAICVWFIIGIIITVIVLIIIIISWKLQN